MTFYTRKLVFGLITSVIGILVTLVWYKYDLSKSKYSGSGDKKVVAHLLNSKNDVQKKLTQRVVWQSLEDSDELHVGEAVRTGGESEAKILFISGTQIEMDPDSVISIEDTGDKINLNFLKGNLVVRGGAKNSGLGLKAGSTDINLGNGEIALNKAQGKNLDLQVLQGTAEVKQGDKKVTLDREKSGQISENGINVSEQFIKIKSPTPFSKVFIRTDKKEPVIFEWSPLPDKFEIYLEVGKTRERLEKLNYKVSGQTGKMSVQLKPGIMFWRLVASDKQEPAKNYSTIPTKLTVVAEVLPYLISPAKDSVVALSPVSKTLGLRWTNPSHLEKLHVEVSNDPSFAKNALREDVDDIGIHEAKLTQEGIYYWRVVGFRQGTTQEVSSEVHKFSLKTKIPFTAPEVKGPSTNSRVSLDSIVSGQVYLAWNPILGVNKYNVRIFRQEGQKMTPAFQGIVSDANQFKFNQNKPGIYRWDVATVNGEGKISPVSPARTLVVEDLPSISWVVERNQEEYEYVGSKPQLKVSFQPYAKADSYKVLYKAVDGNIAEVSFDNKQTSGMINLEKDGIYPVTIEAINAEGKAVARSRIKNYNVKQAPFLPPPEFSEKLGDNIRAQKNGSVVFGFKPVRGAKGYVVNLKDPTGKIEKAEKVFNTVAVLKNLMPGSYKITLATVDASGRVGPDGKEKGLFVPSVGDTRAPSFKKVRIK